ncbi:hypothetical protein [uncultured Granulicatella sp.]|uniref:hypothetical protein n=1 Tax=uncultured Granulicatella sp. TaxID=316089 RepID=UPI0028D41FDC|nr:hypothetical protein [uncultured Granulicatella sp.]
MNRLQKICLAVIWNIGAFAGCVLSSFDYRFIIFFLITLITTPLVIKLFYKIYSKKFCRITSK